MLFGILDGCRINFEILITFKTVYNINYGYFLYRLTPENYVLDT